jgi:hypothetical protein
VERGSHGIEVDIEQIYKKTNGDTATHEAYIISQYNCEALPNIRESGCEVHTLRVHPRDVRVSVQFLTSSEPGVGQSASD